MKMPKCPVSAGHEVIIVPGTEIFRCVECNAIIHTGALPKSDAQMMQEDIEAVMNRWRVEGNLSVYEALGALRICELNLIDRLKAACKK